ncbi:hypothetical protein SNEBB_000442 [Seison nebaliae]|nr:hypothetical protein SNEBB_000442 [Seison nebaliae]
MVVQHQELKEQMGIRRNKMNRKTKRSISLVQSNLNKNNNNNTNDDVNKLTSSKEEDLTNKLDEKGNEKSKVDEKKEEKMSEKTESENEELVDNNSKKGYVEKPKLSHNNDLTNTSFNDRSTNSQNRRHRHHHHRHRRVGGGGDGVYHESYPYYDDKHKHPHSYNQYHHNFVQMTKEPQMSLNVNDGNVMRKKCSSYKTKPNKSHINRLTTVHKSSRKFNEDVDAFEQLAASLYGEKRSTINTTSLIGPSSIMSGYSQSKYHYPTNTSSAISTATTATTTATIMDSSINNDTNKSMLPQVSPEMLQQQWATLMSYLGNNVNQSQQQFQDITKVYPQFQNQPNQTYDQNNSYRNYESNLKDMSLKKPQQQYFMHHHQQPIIPQQQQQQQQQQPPQNATTSNRVGDSMFGYGYSTISKQTYGRKSDKGYASGRPVYSEKIMISPSGTESVVQTIGDKSLLGADYQSIISRSRKKRSHRRNSYNAEAAELMGDDYAPYAHRQHSQMTRDYNPVIEMENKRSSKYGTMNSSKIRAYRAANNMEGEGEINLKNSEIKLLSDANNQPLIDKILKDIRHKEKLDSGEEVEVQVIKSHQYAAEGQPQKFEKIRKSSRKTSNKTNLRSKTGPPKRTKSILKVSKSKTQSKAEEVEVVEEVKKEKVNNQNTLESSKTESCETISTEKEDEKRSNDVEDTPIESVTEKSTDDGTDNKGENVEEKNKTDLKKTNSIISNASLNKNNNNSTRNDISSDVENSDVDEDRTDIELNDIKLSGTDSDQFNNSDVYERKNEKKNVSVIPKAASTLPKTTSKQSKSTKKKKSSSKHLIENGSTKRKIKVKKEKLLENKENFRKRKDKTHFYRHHRKHYHHPHVHHQYYSQNSKNKYFYPNANIQQQPYQNTYQSYNRNLDDYYNDGPTYSSTWHQYDENHNSYISKSKNYRKNMMSTSVNTNHLPNVYDEDISYDQPNSFIIGPCKLPGAKYYNIPEIRMRKLPPFSLSGRTTMNGQLQPQTLTEMQAIARRQGKQVQARPIPPYSKASSSIERDFNFNEPLQQHGHTTKNGKRWKNDHSKVQYVGEPGDTIQIPQWMRSK